MFSVDYPYEDIHQACDWFDPLELEAGLKEKKSPGVMPAAYLTLNN